MKIAYLWGTDYSNIFAGNGADASSAYILIPKNEPLFPGISSEKIVHQFKNRAIPVSYEQDAIAETLLSIDPDVIISMGWRKILGAELLCRLQNKLFINIHPAILPEYKGYHTEPYVIINNEKEHGITAHFLTQQLDNGNIIHQKRFPISEFSTVKSIKKQAYDLMPVFIKELLSMLESGDVIGHQQDSLKTKVIAPKRNPEDSEIDPTKSLIELYHFIRACEAEHYPAFFYRSGQKILITMRRDHDAKRENEFEL